MTRILNTSYHKTKDKGRNEQEYKAHSLGDIVKGLNHNHRVYSNEDGMVNDHFCYSKIDPDYSDENYSITAKAKYADGFNQQVPQQYLDDYNKKVGREDRKIHNYFEFIQKKNKQALAEQLVISLGSEDSLGDINALLKGKKSGSDFWSTYTNHLHDKLIKLIPDFKIYDMTLHLDETTPHVHVVGTGFKHTPDAKQGLKFRLASASIFTRESLRRQHEELRKFHQSEAQRLTEFVKQEKIFWNEKTGTAERVTGVRDQKIYSDITFKASQTNLENRESISDKQIANVVAMLDSKDVSDNDFRILERHISLSENSSYKRLGDFCNFICRRHGLDIDKEMEEFLKPKKHELKHEDGGHSQQEEV